ncbi:TGS domain-containing protein [Pseudomonas sp. TH03]|uniref:His/Gly/Thr/Pro-type tRNA ligase C-terminal domain-containing protein n=1 Tax=Pseudomonas sp. TH03 TaxID=2796369 RepID=UPI001913AAE8|nr:His/Gly/Thr/Pro-type tRNA ligase C-terminal domain-containing protein [Pseudomonas sp. TH03]MBK5548916.1 TGS domain-containing protein [Pseudomonas sp. TH03]
MIHITLPDGSLREYDQPLSVIEVAASIGLALAQAAVAGRVDGVLVDCGFMIQGDARVSIVTPREPDGLEIVRRSCALMLAMAVKQLHPNVLLLKGSALGDGFFYEFAMERMLSLDDLPQIEMRMRMLAATNHSIRCRDLSSTERLSVYRLGDAEYLTNGPHVPATKVLQAFALDHVGGNSLQRIYGTCWSSQQELDHWRAPPQVMVVNIDERQIAYTQSVTEELRRSGVRALADLRNEKIAYKIRAHSERSVPYLLVVGEKEMDGGFVSVRSCSGEDFGRMRIDEVCGFLHPKDCGV